MHAKEGVRDLILDEGYWPYLLKYVLPASLLLRLTSQEGYSDSHAVFEELFRSRRLDHRFTKASCKSSPSEKVQSYLAGRDNEAGRSGYYLIV